MQANTVRMEATSARSSPKYRVMQALVRAIAKKAPLPRMTKWMMGNGNTTEPFCSLEDFLLPSALVPACPCTLPLTPLPTQTRTHPCVTWIRLLQGRGACRCEGTVLLGRPPERPSRVHSSSRNCLQRSFGESYGCICQDSMLEQRPTMFRRW